MIQYSVQDGVHDPRVEPVPTSIIGYVRLSMSRKNGLSLEVQKAAIQDYAQSVGLPVVAIYEEHT